MDFTSDAASCFPRL